MTEMHFQTLMHGHTLKES